MGRTTKSAHHVAQGSVGKIHHPPPAHITRVQASFITPVNVVVDQRRQQIMGRGDGVEVTVEMQIDVFHRNHLRAATAGCAPFHAETGAQGGLPQAHGRTHAQAIETVVQSHTGGGLALPRGRYGGHQYQLAPGRTI